MTGPAGAPARRSVSYLPGRWSALVTDELSLLTDVHLADPLLAACWEAGGTGGVDAVLEVLARPGQQRAPSFVLVAADADSIRLVVAGSAHAEVFAGGADPVVHGAGEGGAWAEQRLEIALDLRLVAEDPTPFERISPLPLTSGIVLASYVFSTAGAPPPPPAAPQDDAVGWIPPPLAQPSREYPAAPAWEEPATQLSGVFRALPWRSSVLDADTADADTDTSGDEPDTAAPPPTPDAPVGTPVPPDPAPADLPSLGAPGYEPPPFGADAWQAQAPAPADYAYPPPPPPPPAASMPSTAAAPPALVDDAPADVIADAPLVQAVHCPDGHLNPLHIDTCRVCGSDVAAQQPITVERPPLGVLRLSTGETVPLDRDLLLGRAPFAVDRRNVRLVEVPSPNNDISRSHVRITLDGWQVFVTDLGSTNGTAVTLPGQPAALLRPHDPFALAPGSVLSLADEAQARFDVI